MLPITQNSLYISVLFRAPQQLTGLMLLLSSEYFQRPPLPLQTAADFRQRQCRRRRRLLVIRSPRRLLLFGLRRGRRGAVPRPQNPTGEGRRRRHDRWHPFGSGRRSRSLVLWIAVVDVEMIVAVTSRSGRNRRKRRFPLRNRRRWGRVVLLHKDIRTGVTLVINFELLRQRGQRVMNDSIRSRFGGRGGTGSNQIGAFLFAFVSGIGESGNDRDSLLRIGTIRLWR